MPNLRLALRTLARTPFVTGVAVLSLALGIGVNAAIFSGFDQLLLRRLPVAEPERLVNLSAPGPKPGSTSCNQAGPCEQVFSYPMFRDLEDRQTVFTGLAGHRSFQANLAAGGETSSTQGMLVSGSYFSVLGLRPALGRLLGPADDEVVAGHFVAVLSHDYWDARLGRDPDVIGRSIVVNGQTLTVVGVAPRGFEGTTLGVRPAVYVPLTMRGLMAPGFDGFENRRNYWLYVFGRLRPGVEPEAAATAINAIYRPIIQEVELPLQVGMSEAGLTRFAARELAVEPGSRGQSWTHSEARTPILMLFGLTGIVLLIACANIASLLLARGAGRGLEVGVRLSLGARRSHILGQLMAEALVLGAVAAVVSLVFARGTLALLAWHLPPEATSVLDVSLNARVLLFAGALGLATGVLFGLFPALHGSRPDLVTLIRGGSAQLSGARTASRFRSVLVTAQIALAMTLLVSAGLFAKSLRNVARVDLGVQVDNVVAFGISPELNGYDQPRSQLLFERLTEDLAALPGVTAVSSAMVPILVGDNWGNDVSVEGFRREPDTNANASYNELAPDYFRTLGVPLLAGRDFTTADAAGAPKVAIVNEAFTRKFGLPRDAVGRLMAVGSTEQLDMEIVGVVQDAKYNEVKGEIPPLYYTPYLQSPRVRGVTYYVRTAGDPAALLRSLPGVVAAHDPNLPLENLKTMPQQVRESMGVDRMVSTLSVAFAALATLLAGIGLYGVLAYSVAQRTREIGVRMALGADASRVRAMVLRQVTPMVLTGIVLGIGAALAVGRLAGSLLFELQSHDPLVLLVAVTTLGCIAFSAALVPALRASAVQPSRALRGEG